MRGQKKADLRGPVPNGRRGNPSSSRFFLFPWLWVRMSNEGVPCPPGFPGLSTFSIIEHPVQTTGPMLKEPENTSLTFAIEGPTRVSIL